MSNPQRGGGQSEKKIHERAISEKIESNVREKWKKHSQK
jgi:hypothetical protein